MPEPQGSDFIVMTPMRRDRLETNVDTPFDCLFTASIAGTVMTVTALSFGIITLGNQLFGTGVSGSPLILSQMSGSVGGTGVYTTSVAQTLPSQVLASGVKDLLQSTRFLIQLDVHGPNSGDNAQVVSTIFRDEYGVDLFAAQCVALGLDQNAVVPLYSDDPNQMPFINDQDQYENRWVIEAFLQANEHLTTPQQYADSVVVTNVDVVTAYPA